MCNRVFRDEVTSRPLAFRLKLFAFLCGITVLSLSIHVVMLQGLHVPYPNYRGVGSSLGLAIPFTHALGLIMLYQLAKRSVDCNFLYCVFGVTLLDSMITEKLRIPIMDAVVTGSIAFQSLVILSNLVECVCLALLIVLLTPYLKNGFLSLMGATAIAAVLTFLIDPQLQNVMAHFAWLGKPDTHQGPYGPGILSVSYILFVGTAAAAVAIIWLIGSHLSKRPGLNFIQFLLVLFFIRGTFVSQFVFPWKMNIGLLAGSLSTSQFFLQDLVMAFLSWLLWWRWLRTQQSSIGSVT